MRPRAIMETEIRQCPFFWTPEYALLPFRLIFLATPEAADDGPSQATTIPDEAYEETYVLFAQLVAPLPFPRRSSRFESQVVALREDVHKRGRLMGLMCRREIQQFFVELRPITSATEYDTENNIPMRELPAGLGYREIASRKPVEGDCVISLSPLKHSTNSLWPHFTIGDSIHYTGDSGKKRLVWCRARCGVNYHADCFNKWSKNFKSHQQVTCPSCRRSWEK
ncbi:hypothetical protein ASPVEDRAFT_813464 [Aspergillus versicolor CBS 583.65]|uniref:RING-type domain-containing protein n=1 Tax=Aspergillus versicolor CBS 583.65 TaxID=1036611 RepID=A0A1L9PTD7_ASPVE|nr:uncharacterized protein ASPVEDRAFT_813464 [Aspergillus versicolor CBS 583.65]OJJ04789.1 hypothetical protein ASPVEDRAFT_813464 [Aspergillus versicolor CBS 583.65]